MDLLLIGIILGYFGPDLYRFGKVFIYEVKYMIENWRIK